MPEIQEVKGVIPADIKRTHKERYGDRFNEWLENLPAQSREIISGSVLANVWYPLRYAVIEPVNLSVKMFHGGLKQRIKEDANSGARRTINGIYKIFIKLGSPDFLLSRVTNIFAQQYRPGKFIIVDRPSSNSVILQITGFIDYDDVLEYMWQGVIEAGLEINGCKNLKVKCTKSLAKNDKVTEFSVSWE